MASYTIAYPSYLGASYDASTTNFTYVIPGPLKSKTELTLSFLSPITPTSTLRQSIPASYLKVYVKGDANLDIYIDLNGQWVSGDRGRQLVWEFGETPIGGKEKFLKTWAFKQRDELLFTEHGDQAEWGVLHFSGPSVCQFLPSRNCFLMCDRTSAMNVVPLLYFVKGSRRPVLFKTLWTTISVLLWMKNRFSLSPNRSV